MLKPLQTEDSAPWKLRFRAPTIWSTQIAARAPTRGLVVGTQTGTLQFFAWDVPTGTLRQLTDRPGGMSSFPVLEPDGCFFYYFDDRRGNEVGHYVRARYDAPADGPQDLTPDWPPYSSQAPYASFGISGSGNRLGFRAADAQGFHIYVMDVGEEAEPSAAREIYRSDKPAAGPLLSASGDVAVIMTAERTGKTAFDLIAYDLATGTKLAELSDGDDNNIEMLLASPIRGDPRLLATTNRSGFETLLMWNPRTGERVNFALEGVIGGIRAYDWSLDGERILLRTFNGAVQQLYLHCLSSGRTARLNCPPGVHSPYFMPDGKEIVSHWQDAATPIQVVALDSESGTMTRSLLNADEVPPGRPLRSVSFPSSDGQLVQGWLGVPEGEGPFPLIFHVHGGPQMVAANSFSPQAQAWLDFGFAFFSLNYRGSTTFGKAFQQQIWGNLGYWEIEDMVAGRDYLVKQGIARPEAVLLTGWSYGGYLTLLGLGKRPGLWAGGMAGAPMADFFVQYEDSSELMRRWQRAMLGGSPEEKPEQYAKSSPITYVENVSAPVLIIQGRNDTRTPARPVQLYEAKLKALGKPIEVHWYDTGHAGSSSDVELGLKHQEVMMRFAYRVFGESLPA